LTPDLALEQAHAAEKDIQRGHYRGPLHGNSVRGERFAGRERNSDHLGARSRFAGQVFDYNATVIEHLHNVGAILLGKAAMIELAGRDGICVLFGFLAGRNEKSVGHKLLDVRIVFGGRARLSRRVWAGFAIGTETWGSIVCPSAFLRRKRVAADVRAR